MPAPTPRTTRVPSRAPEGVVSAVVATTNMRDDVADVLLPGCFAETLRRRKPKVCLFHHVDRPAGRILHIAELLPGDAKLPATTRTGAPWPPSWGALVADFQLNLDIEDGRRAFSLVKFYGPDADYSIGYKVVPGRASRGPDGSRLISAIDLYEISIVLFGANPATATLAVKSRPPLEHKIAVPRRRTAARAVLEAKQLNSEQLRPVPVIVDDRVLGYVSPVLCDGVVAAWATVSAGPRSVVPTRREAVEALLRAGQ